MNADDDFPAVGEVFERSRIAGAARWILDRGRAAASRSAVIGAVRGSIGVGFLDRAERVRFVGLVLLVATITHAFLVESTLPMIRPAAPGVLRVELILVGLLLVVLAGPIASAWKTSRAHQLF